MRWKPRQILRVVWAGAGLLVTAWMYIGFQSVDLPEGVLHSGEQVTVSAVDDGFVFRDRSNERRAGLIFLPGGLVDPRAYAPLMRGIAEAGYEARLMELPMRCACTDSQVKRLFDGIRAVIDAQPDRAWVLGGHSRGAMLATRYVHERGASGLAGLALVATTHPRDFSLADVKMPVVKIYGTQDGVANYDKMRGNAGLLPAGTKWVAIQGGNHSQFGYYRHQFGEGTAVISRERQQREVKAALAGMLGDATRSLK